jgi:oxidase EvaA
MVAGMTTPVLLRARRDAGLPDRIAGSVAATGRNGWLAEFRRWFAQRRQAHRFRVRRVPFAELDGWSFDPATGNLGHRSGKFFTLEGLQVELADGQPRQWQQPIIVQPEVGILGILAREFDGVLHFLMQAKMEPGNRRTVQLSPTVQATRSNYTRVHQGQPVRYLEHFVRPGRSRVLVDVLQSEHGSWFYRKVNRNIIIEVFDEVPAAADFHWLTLGQIGRLLREDNLVNMDSRTVLSGLPVEYGEAGAVHADVDLLSWFTAERARRDLHTRRIPLDRVAGWTHRPDSIDHASGRYFRVVAVAVTAGSREVTGWTQPLIEPHGLGVCAFLVRRFGGVPHLLAQARAECGFLDTVELGPTVQLVPDNHPPEPGRDRPPFLDLVLGADPDRIRYQAVHSEEGGRFRHAESRYLLIDVDEPEAPAVPPAGFRWVTPGQLSSLVRHPHYVNVQARSLLAVLNTRAARL